MSSLTLYTVPQSRGSKVLWMLEECAADYQTVVLDWPDLAQADYLAINPLVKVPALKVDGTVLTETLAIIAWLAERYPGQGLIPAEGSVARGGFYRWMCFSLQLEHAAVDRLRQVENEGMLKRAIGYGDFDAAFGVLRRHLQDHAFMVGDRFGALDLYYAGLLQWLVRKVQLLPADDPVLVPWMERQLARPAHQRAVGIELAWQEQPAG